VLAAVDLGMEPDKAAGALSTFLGASRRFQIRSVEKGVTVVDDYAHHPTEIAALLDAARRRYPDSRIHVLFQPHLFSRTRFFAGEFARALAKADDVIVTGIFPARERQEDYPDVTGAIICDQAKALTHTPQEDWIRDVEDMQVAAQMIALRAHHGDVIITVGAGDITAMVPVVLHALEAHRDTCEA
jgi:UDP-N-acetylmuramate--alanine ligase